MQVFFSVLQLFSVLLSVTHVGGKVQGVPGVGGEDYPIYSSVPTTSFSCLDKPPGFYADPEARCQVFHICSTISGQQSHESFLCPNGTMFNMAVNTCDWWNKVDCPANISDSVQLTIPAWDVKQSDPTTRKSSVRRTKQPFRRIPKLDPENALTRTEIRGSKAEISSSAPNVDPFPKVVSIKPRNRHRNSDHRPFQRLSATVQILETTSSSSIGQRDIQSSDEITEIEENPNEMSFKEFNDSNSPDNLQPMKLTEEETHANSPDILRKTSSKKSALRNRDKPLPNTLLLSANYSFSPLTNANTLLKRKVSNKYSVEESFNDENHDQSKNNNEPPTPVFQSKPVTDIDPVEDPVSSIDFVTESFINRFTFNYSDISAVVLPTKSNTTSNIKYLPTQSSTQPLPLETIQSEEIPEIKQTEQNFTTNSNDDSKHGDEFKLIKGHYITEPPPTRDVVYPSDLSTFGIDETSPLAVSTISSIGKGSLLTTINPDSPSKIASPSPSMIEETEFREYPLFNLDVLEQPLSFENSHVIWPFFSRQLIPEINLNPNENAFQNPSSQVLPLRDLKIYSNEYLTTEHPSLGNSEEPYTDPLRSLKNYQEENVEHNYDNAISSTTRRNVEAYTKSSVAGNDETEIKKVFEDADGQHIQINSPNNNPETDSKPLKQTYEESVFSTPDSTDREIINYSKDFVKLKNIRGNPNFNIPLVTLNAQDLTNINNLEITGLIKDKSTEIVKSVGFSLESEEDLKEYEKARSAGWV